MKYISLIVIALLAFTGLNAQDVKKEKKVTVNVKEEGDRKVKIVTNEDGKENVIEWTDKGEIPEDIRKQLKEEGINVEMLDSDKGNIWVEVDSDNKKGRKEKVIKIKKGVDGDDEERVIVYSDDGDVEVIEDKEYHIVIVDDEGETIEWDGEGDMPDELKKHMKENNIEIEELHEGEGRHRIRMHRGGDNDVRILRGRNRRGDNMMFFHGEDDIMQSKSAKVFVGARVEDHEEGATIMEVLDDSPAAKAKLKSGDVITKINGARTRSVHGFLDLLHHFDPGDKVTLTVLREGKSQTFDLTLSARPEDFK